MKQQVVTTVNANDLVIIAQMAYEYGRKISVDSQRAEDFLKKVQKFRDEVCKTWWDDNAEILLIEK